MSEINRQRGSVVIPKTSLAVAPAQLVVIDPSRDGFTNITAGCFMAGEVFSFFARFERALTESEDRFFEEAKATGLLGKFRDLDLTYSDRIESDFGSKSAWVLSLLDLPSGAK